MDSEKAGESQLLDELLGLDPRAFDEDDERTRVFQSDPPPADPAQTPAPTERLAVSRPSNPRSSKTSNPRSEGARAPEVTKQSPSRAAKASPPEPPPAEQPSDAIAADVLHAYEEEQSLAAKHAAAEEATDVSDDAEDDAETELVPEVEPIETASFEPGPLSISQNDRLIGALIDGRYRVESVLGVGGIGIVYLCQHEVLEKPVAIKILRREYVLHDDLNERFLNEARASSAIKSPRIVDTIDVGSLPDGTPYFVMEYVDGETLASLLDREGAIDLVGSVDIARQIAEGLEAAHAAGVIHRDLKPENVFLAPAETPGFYDVKIFDFGIAKVARARKRLTYAGAVFGTPHYMSPEQARGETVDTTSDIYALGVMLFEMVTGNVPFDGDDPLAVMSQHVDRVPPLLSAIRRTGVPASLEAVVARCLAKDPRDRYASANDFLLDLARLDRAELSAETPPGAAVVAFSPAASSPLDGVDVVAKQVPRAETLHAHVVSKARLPAKRKHRVIVGAAVGVVLVAGAAWWGTRGEPASRASSAASPSTLTAVADGETSQTKSETSNGAGHGEASHEVHFVLSPIDAHLFRDDDDLGPMPVTVTVPDGVSQTFTVRRKGYSTRRVVVDGSETRVVIGLVPVPAPSSKLPKGGKPTSSLRRRGN
jgi:serine/threonine protein kinase